MYNTIIISIFIMMGSITQLYAQSQNLQESNSQHDTLSQTQSNSVASEFDAFFNSTIRKAFEIKLLYYETSTVLERIAKLDKKYYDALIKSGFTKEEALRIMIANPLIVNLSPN